MKILASSKRTTQVRIRKKFLEEINLRFPDVRKADLIEMAFRTNPMMRGEMFLRKVDDKLSKNIRKNVRNKR